MTDDYFDVVIVGAGLSGIGAACHLQQQCPGKSWVILESRDAVGGTWDLFRYPGIRSDSDMYTLGYDFRPWDGDKAIADGPAILQYIRDTAVRHGIDTHVRCGHRVTAAQWSCEAASWTLQIELMPTGTRRRIRCNMLLMCAGYYRYEHGYSPRFEGVDRYHGQVIHPQAWPADLDYRGQRIVVIGSGATAVTLVPELARTAAHVVMLQRSPSYVIAQPDSDAIALVLRRLLPGSWAHRLIRRKNIALQQWLYRQSRIRPRLLKRFLLRKVRKELGPAFDVGRHFTPGYDPWDQRMCVVPNGDLFAAIRSGRASVVTDTIAHFTGSGIELDSGKELQADIVVTATGLELVVLGDIPFLVDEVPFDFAASFTYKGAMCSGLPNLVSTFGYINASWTLRADLIADFSCRLINHMDTHGVRQCTPRLRPGDRDMPASPWVTGFSSGYIQRVMASLPKQGDREPWLNPQDYRRDIERFRTAPVTDGVLEFI